MNLELLSYMSITVSTFRKHSIFKEICCGFGPFMAFFEFNYSVFVQYLRESFPRLIISGELGYQSMILPVRVVFSVQLRKVMGSIHLWEFFMNLMDFKTSKFVSLVRVCRFWSIYLFSLWI